MITLTKIAKLAHVSVSTASKAFSMSDEVSRETREAIFKVAKENGCFKKFFNAKYPKLVIAIICPEFNSLYYTGLTSEIQAKLTQHNCEINVASTGFSKQKEAELLDYYLKYSDVDGIIIIGNQIPIEKFSEIPIVAVNGFDENCCISVKSSHHAAIKEIIEHFVKSGIKEIGFIGDPLTQTKLEYFKQIFIEKCGTINEDFISISDKRFEAGGYYAMNRLFEKNKVPRAVICAYDYMAIGAIKAIKDHGLCVPKDVAVVGMDDISEAEFLNPPLASINPQNPLVADCVVKNLINFLEGMPYQKHTVINSVLNLRKSAEIYFNPSGEGMY